jgi:dTDP-4-amino-4,6-dideoxygalactose transaminase
MDQITKTRQDACRYYNEQLRSVAEVITPKTDFEGITPFLYYIRVPADKRDALRAAMLEQGVDTGIHWQPGHWFTLLSDCRRGDLEVTERVGQEILTLPLHSAPAAGTVERVVEGVRSFFSKRAQR